jgi:pyruvate dehydrogenase E1 component beta subunit
MATRELTFAQAINEGLRQEMRRDPTIFLMGENVSSDRREATSGLMKEFGKSRVRDTPITESSFVGAGVGAAIAGMRPVVEIMLVDFALVAMEQILNQAAKARYMLGGAVSVPLTLRALYGAGTSSGATHSESLYSLFAHMPGLRVVVPSNPYDAKGLLISSLRDDNPKVFFEHRLLYSLKGPVPEESYTVSFGRAEVKRKGEDVTIVAAGLMLHKALEAASRLAKEEISVEVIDPRTLVPLDRKTILGSVKKTSRLVVVDEDYERCGFASEVAALVADEGFDYLSAPVKRIATPNVPVPYNPKLEKHVLPDEDKIVKAVHSLLARKNL